MAAFLSGSAVSVIPFWHAAPSLSTGNPHQAHSRLEAFHFVNMSPRERAGAGVRASASARQCERAPVRARASASARQCERAPVRASAKTRQRQNGCASKQTIAKTALRACDSSSAKMRSRQNSDSKKSARAPAIRQARKRLPVKIKHLWRKVLPFRHMPNHHSRKYS
jgi:hypothetical protein